MYEPGGVLAGKYRILGSLGKGGMGIVLAAEHIELRTTVAIKCLVDKFAGRADVVKRLLREARASAQLRSEHICRVFDVGRLETGVPYFVMELLDGSDLAFVLRSSGPLDVATAISYVLQACDAVEEAHGAHIIHRDLKPANLFVTQRRDGTPCIKVLDFGVAKAPDDGDAGITDTRMVIGSPRYMAPEQIRASKNADERSDIWSLGVILYELVSGHPPFQAASISELATRIATEPIVPLSDVPAEFAAVVDHCLEKAAERRFQCVGELAQALAACIERAPDRPRAAPDPDPGWSAVSGIGTFTTLHDSGLMPEKRAVRGWRRELILAGAVAIAGGAGIGFAFGLGSDRTGDRADAVQDAVRAAPVQVAPAPVDAATGSPVVEPAPTDLRAIRPTVPVTPARAVDHLRRPEPATRRVIRAKSKPQTGETRR